MKGRSGQITVLVLLLSMLTLLGGLSIASRSLSDLKQVTYVGSGTKALAAAEVGLQYALANQANFSTIGDCSFRPVTGLSLTGVDLSSVQYKVCGVTRNSITVPDVQKDDTVQVDFSGVTNNFNSFDVSWRGDAAIEIEVIDSEQSSNNNYYLRRYAYNSNTKPRSNGFAAGLSGSNCVVPGRPQDICDTSFSSGSCTGYGEFVRDYRLPGNGSQVRARLVRIKPLYQATDVMICAQTSGASQTGFGLQYYQVTATAKAIDGSTKKIQADHYPAGLPAIFDNVLYSGGNISK